MHLKHLCLVVLLTLGRHRMKSTYLRIHLKTSPARPRNFAGTENPGRKAEPGETIPGTYLSCCTVHSKITAKVVVQESTRAAVNLFDVKSTIFAKYAHLGTVRPMFNKALATRSLFETQHPARISKCITVTNSFLEVWE